METVANFLSLGSKITVDSDCTHEIKRHLFPGRKAMANPDSILKSRDITLSIKVCIVKAIVFPVVMWWYESWSMKKAKHWRTDDFLALENTLESPLDSGDMQQVYPKRNQSWIFIGRSMLKLKLQYFGHLTVRADSLEKTLMLGKTEGKRRRGQQRMRQLYSITDSMDLNLSNLQEIVEYRRAWCAAVHGITKSQTWLSDKTRTNVKNFRFIGINHG